MAKAEPRRNDRKPDMARVERLIARFDGLIKYTSMLMDHPDWSDDECVEFAKKWHAVAKDRLDNPKDDMMWNDRIPYCRNLPKNVDAA